MNASVGALATGGKDRTDRETHGSAPVPTHSGDVCADCAVRHESLCGQLADDTLTVFHRMGTRKRIARGETFAWAGGKA